MNIGRIESLIENYENSVSITGRKQYYPFSMIMPWKDLDPCKREKIEHNIIYDTFNNLKVKDIFPTCIFSEENIHTNDYSVYYRSARNFKLNTTRIECEPKFDRINLNFAPAIISEYELEYSAIDYTSHIVKYYTENLSKEIDNFFIGKLIQELGNKVFTELGFFKKGDYVLQAFENIIENTLNLTGTGNFKCILLHPSTKRMIDCLRVNPLSNYQWTEGIQFLEFESVPTDYLYIVVCGSETNLSNIICIKNLLVCNRNGELGMEWDGGLLNKDYFGRIKLKSN